ncbi:ABC transporter ATP-binding protein [Enterococcus sp. LJL98]
MTVQKILTHFLARNKSLIGLLLASLGLQVTGTLMVPFLVARLIDQGIASRELSVVWSIGGQMLFVALLTGVAGVLGSYFSAKVAARFSYFAREAVFRKVQELTIDEVNQLGVASLLARTINDVENISESLVLFSQLILPAPMIGLIAIYLTGKVSTVLVWIPLAVVVLFLLLTGLLVYKGNRYSVMIQEKMDRMVRSVREFYTGARVIRAFNKQAVEKDKTHTAFHEYAQNMIQLNYLFATLTPVVSALLGGALTAILWFGAFEVANQTMQIGSITAVVEYVTLAIMYVLMAAMVFITLPGAYASLERLKEVLEKESPIQDPIEKDTQLPSQKEVVVQFKEVSFTYPDAEESVLNQISFEVKRGETLAIVGSTGSGKSTIAKLLFRLNEVSQGAVLVNGVDVRLQNQIALRNQMSYVPQKSFLFHGTILENLQFAEETASRQRIEAAAQIAQAAPFIEKLPQQYESFVAQGGSNYSGGQKQRLSIARALVKHADLYVFDDSFSALDYQTDKIVRQGIKQSLRDVATIIVAQRLSTVVDADRILLLDEGRIVAQGTHQDLLVQSSLYRAFAQSQQLIEEGDVHSG